VTTMDPSNFLTKSVRSADVCCRARLADERVEFLLSFRGCGKLLLVLDRLLELFRARAVDLQCCRARVLSDAIVPAGLSLTFAR
jgi:hypothetical protein